MNRLLVAFLLLQAALQTPAPKQAPTPANQTPTNTTPAAPDAPVAPDPASVTFTTDIGMVLNAVKPGLTSDYEAAIVALQEALAKSPDEEIRRMASGWRVFKASEVDAKANALYVHMLQPALPGVDYRPSLWLDKLLAGAPPELLAKYRDAFAGPPSKLALIELADMSVAPVQKPANATPGGPTTPKVPGNRTAPKPGNVSPR